MHQTYSAASKRSPPPEARPAEASEPRDPPESLFRYIVASTGPHQAALVALTVIVFLIELVPLELQRRIVNDLAKHRDYGGVLMLGAIYASAVLTQGSIKLGLNVYRSWVGERITRDLRRKIRGCVGLIHPGSPFHESQGVAVSMIVAEVDPIGGFIGESFSEPLLQGGILCSVVSYMIHIEPFIALSWFVFFVPQLVFVPLMQGAINRRTRARVWTLRRLSISLVDLVGNVDRRRPADNAQIDRVFALNMGIFRLKFTMNFLMNLCTHLQVIAALLVGGWFVYANQLEVGGVVAFISAIGRLNDPWGDLVNYFRDASATKVKFRMMVDAMRQMPRDQEREEA